LHALGWRLKNHRQPVAAVAYRPRALRVNAELSRSRSRSSALKRLPPGSCAPTRHCTCRVKWARYLRARDPSAVCSVSRIARRIVCWCAVGGAKPGSAGCCASGFLSWLLRAQSKAHARMPAHLRQTTQYAFLFILGSSNGRGRPSTLANAPQVNSDAICKELQFKNVWPRNRRASTASHEANDSLLRVTWRLTGK